MLNLQTQLFMSSIFTLDKRIYRKNCYPHYDVDRCSMFGIEIYIMIQFSGHLKETLKEFIERRVKLKLAETLAEQLAEKVHQDISDKEAKLRREYEDKMRR